MTKWKQGPSRVRRVVVSSKIGSSRINTVELNLNHPDGQGTRRFETIVLGGPMNWHRTYHATEQEAVSAHHLMKDRLANILD